ncbi:hypothetical protein EUX98_g191 [Antrodiella citrinella]|uniref:Endonuclease/exonuclease/phosphatase domain-containing protein n=1 Tax=Antrodiella citrinella TaxID=2447956 RepID=A0A4S4N4Z6_9APHY|nr:hypothetical protein EUX98_g191 [Antrodiella citrinella]
MLIYVASRTEKLFPVLKEAGYNHVYKAGPQKKHGCLIAFRSEVLELYAQKQIPYDDHEVHPDAPVTTPFVKRCGSSFRTKNIANLVALKWKDSEDGVIVATTHLFWHPSYTYERTRQAAILLREVSRFRHGLGKDNWPCIVAGDFNFAPDDPAYSLLVGDALSPRQSSRLDVSRVVHHTIDPNVPITTKKMMGEDEGGAEGEEKDPDRIIVNARKAVPDDGLLTDEQLREICTRAGQAFSAYDRGLSQDKTIDAELLFGSRVPLERGKQGAAEPVWTSYTHFWKVVLDYIFVLDPKRDVTVVGVAAPHPTKDLDPGLPRKGVCASDHISLCADLTWSAS